MLPITQGFLNLLAVLAVICVRILSRHWTNILGRASHINSRLRAQVSLASQVYWWSLIDRDSFVSTLLLICASRVNKWKEMCEKLFIVYALELEVNACFYKLVYAKKLGAFRDIFFCSLLTIFFPYPKTNCYGFIMSIVIRQKKKKVACMFFSFYFPREATPQKSEKN